MRRGISTASLKRHHFNKQRSCECGTTQASRERNTSEVSHLVDHTPGLLLLGVPVLQFDRVGALIAVVVFRFRSVGRSSSRCRSVLAGAGGAARGQSGANGAAAYALVL